MKTEVHEINVQKAKDFLEKNLPFERGAGGTNRPVSTRKVNEYAFAMLSGNWRLTHQGIGFSTKGFLKDGQHRLLALVQAAEEGATIGDITLKPKPTIKLPFQVTFGLDEDIFEYLDNGLARSAAQILAIAGYSNQTHLAAAARLLFLFDNHEFKFWRSVKVTNHQVLEIVNKTGLAEYIPPVSPLTPIGFISVASAVGYYVCERAFPSGPHENWLNGLLNGENLTSTDPRMVLRNYAIRSKGQPKIRRDSFNHLALWILGWNDFTQGKKRSAISWRTTLPFPKPIEKK